MAQKRQSTGSGKSNVVKASASRGKGPFYAILGVVVVVFGVFIAAQMRKEAPKVVPVDPSTPLPKAEGYLLGSADAPVQVLEFADFECPACGNFASITEPDVRKRLVETGMISFRFLDFPLPMHQNTWAASQAAACANEQGKFWEMHDQIFATQDQWNTQATQRPKGLFKKLAESVGLKVDQWEQCYDAEKYKLNIAANQKEGERRLVSQTPTFIIGSKQIPGSLAFDHFKAYVDSATTASKEPGAGKPQ